MELANKQTLVSPIHLLSYAQTFVFKVLRDGLPRCILYTCLQPVITFVFKMLCDGLPRYTYFTHVQTCDNFRCQSASRWTASVHTSHMSKPVITLVFKVPSNGLLNSIKLAQSQSFLRDPYFWTRAHILDITLVYVRVEIAKLQRRLCVMSILVQKSQIPHAPKKGCQNFSKHRC